MLNADQAPYFHTCPRCGVGGLERLSTHAYCFECNYSESYDEGEFLAIPKWVLETLKAEKPKRVMRESSHANEFKCAI